MPKASSRAKAKQPRASRQAEQPASSGTETTESSQFEKFCNWYKDAEQHSHDWRKQAREDYAFVAGDQWSQEDAAFLKLMNRPIITFNRIDPVIDSVAGLEVNNRQEVAFFPRHVGDASTDELLTGAGKWCRDECNAEDEESDAFRDQLICGMGWTETRLDYDEDPEGKLMILRTDPMKMFWDPSATKKNLSDTRFVMYIDDLPMPVAEDMFPEADPGDLHAAWAMDTGTTADLAHDAQQAPFYRIDQSPLLDKTRVLVRIVEVQWWEHETVRLIVDPITGQRATLTESEHAKLSKRLGAFGIELDDGVKQKRKKFFKAWLGSKVLKESDGPEEGGFTRKCMTGKRDRNKGTFYGLVRGMLDPQRWANRWLSQVMHIINTNAKGGIMAEADAFENPQEAIDNWASPDAVTLMKKGAISGNKWAPKPQAQWPQGLENMMQFAISSIRDASGINLELLGQADRTQPGVLEHQRKQAALTILASLFDSLRRYRKEQGKLLLYYITHFLSDGRLIRIGGQSEARYVPLIRQPDTVKYDVIVDDTPSSVNLKEQAWAALTQMMPILSRIQIPMQVWMSVLKYSPLPASLTAEITQALQQAAQQPKPPDPKLQAAQLDLQGKKMELQGKQMDLQLQQSEAQDSRMRAQVDMAGIQQDAQNRALEGQEAQGRIAKDKSDAILNLANAAKVGHDAQIDRQDATLSALETIVDSIVKMNPPQPQGVTNAG
jgi:hypothetical protein